MSCERAFCKTEIRTWLRASLGYEKLGTVMLMSFENDILDSVSVEWPDACCYYNDSPAFCRLRLLLTVSRILCFAVVMALIVWFIPIARAGILKIYTGDKPLTSLTRTYIITNIVSFKLTAVYSRHCRWLDNLLFSLYSGDDCDLFSAVIINILEVSH